MSYKLVFEETMDKEKVNKKFCKGSNSCIHLFMKSICHYIRKKYINTLTVV